MRKSHQIFSFILIWFVIISCIVIHAFFVDGGFISGDIKGFAVDSDENVYIGVHGKILKLRNNHITDVLRPQLDGTYCFFISNNKLLIGIQREQTVKEYDLQGSFIQRSAIQYHEAEKYVHENRIYQINGNTYEWVSFHGLIPGEIRCNGEVVYRMSFLDYLFSDIIFYTTLSVFGVVAAFLLIRGILDQDVQCIIKGMRKNDAGHCSNGDD